jgi:hypothetical protein
MTQFSKALAAALALAVAAPAVAAEAPNEAKIAFANHGGIQNWRVVDRDTLYIEGRGDRWYKAELFAPAFGLPFAHAIGFVTYPGGTFDRFSKVIVEGCSYPLRSLVEVDGPPPRKGKKADA